jgi:hypothetical protein
MPAMAVTREDGSEVEVCGPAAMAPSKALSFPALVTHHAH